MADKKFLDLAGLQYYHTKKVKEPILDKKGQPNGFAELDGTGKVLAAQLPSYVDDILEFEKQASFPQPGEDGKIYVAKDTNIIYRWSGTTYVEISKSLTLGTTASTAFRGDYGNTAYQHSLKTSGNPHNVKFAELSDRPTELSQFTNDLPKSFTSLTAGGSSVSASTTQAITIENSATITASVAANKLSFNFVGALPEYDAITTAEIDTIV